MMFSQQFQEEEYLKTFKTVSWEKCQTQTSTLCQLLMWGYTKPKRCLSSPRLLKDSALKIKSRLFLLLKKNEGLCIKQGSTILEVISGTLEREGVLHYGLHIFANPVPSSTRNRMQSHLGQKKGDRQEASVEASVLLTSKTLQAPLTPPSSQTRRPERAHTGEMHDQDLGKCSHPSGQNQVSRPSGQWRTRKTLPVSLPWHS